MGIGRGHQPFAHEFGRAHHVGRVDRLVRRRKEYALNLVGIRRVNHILDTLNIGLDGLSWRDFTEVDVLQRSGVQHDIDPAHGLSKFIPITHIAQLKVDTRIAAELFIQKKQFAFVVVQSQNIVGVTGVDLAEQLTSHSATDTCDQDTLSQPGIGGLHFHKVSCPCQGLRQSISTANAWSGIGDRKEVKCASNSERPSNNET